MNRAISSPSHSRLRSVVILLVAMAVVSLVFLTEKPTRSAALPAPQAVTLITLNTKDITYDPLRDRIYASVPSNAATNANTVVSINPQTTQIESSITSGSNPGSLGLSGDGHYLYVSIDDTASIRRVDLQSQTQVPEIPLGIGQFGRPIHAHEIEVLPGQPESIALALEDSGFNHEGVAIFDNGTQRPNKSQTTPPNDRIEFGGSASTLFGLNTLTSEFGLHKFAVDANGLTAVSSLSNVIVGSDADVKFDNGRLYGTNGKVVDPQTMSLVGAFQLPGFGYAVAPDSANNRVYFISQATNDLTPKLWAYDLTTFLPVGNASIPQLSGWPHELIRIGANGLALRTDANQLFIIQLSVIQPLPPAPLPTPTTGPDSVIKLQLATNDLIFDPGTQKVYASTPGSLASFGNSLAPINPATGVVSQPVFVGVDPTRLAISSNNQYLYVGLDGPAGVRRFDLQSQTPGLQFSLGVSSSHGPLYVQDMEVQPGNPSVVAISLKNKNFFPSFEGVAVFDEGVKRSNVLPDNHGSSAIEFSATPSVLYGLDTGSTASGLQKLNVDASGVSVTSEVRNLISGAGDFEFENGLIYANNGQVVDPETQTILGSFPISGLMATDVAANRVYFIDWSPLAPTVTIYAFDRTTFLPVGFLVIQNVSGKPGSFIRCGTNRLAFRTSGNEVYFVPTASLKPYPTVTPSFTTRADGLREFSLPANDIVYNPADQLIYASVPSVAGSIGNSIAAINPATGLVGQPVFIGSEPLKLALSDDGSLLYTTLGGAPRVRKFDIPTKTPGAQFGLGSDFIDGPFYGQNLAVASGNPDMVAVSTYLLPILGGAGVTLTNNGVALPDRTGGNSLTFSGPNLFTYSNDTTEFALRKLATTSTGLSQIGFRDHVISGFGQQIAARSGRIYASDGAVVDPESLNPLGRFVRNDGGIWFAPDPANNRAYFLGLNELRTAAVLTAYDTRTFLQVGSLTISNVFTDDTPLRSFIRFGADGLAFTNAGGKMYFLTTSMITPIAPTPIPTPTQLTAEVKQLSLTTGDLAYSNSDGMIYASVPSRKDGLGAAITFGNSIVPINPTTGAVGQPIQAGSEPKKLAVTRNGQYVYAGLDGDGSVARLDVSTKTIGARFSLFNNGQFKGPRTVQDMEVAPGTVDTLAISLLNYNGGHNAVAIYDNGIQRPLQTEKEFPGVSDSNNVIEYGSSAATLYGYCLDSTNQDFHRMSVSGNGVQVTGTVANPFFARDIRYDNGLIYTNRGEVFNPDTGALVGSFAGVAQGDASLVLPESATGTVYFLVKEFNGSGTVRVYNQNSFALIGTLTFPGPINGNIGSLIRWGTNGLAFRTTSNLSTQGNQLFIIQLPPSLTPSPTPTPTPTPSPSPTPTPTPVPTGPPELLSDSSGPAADQVASLDALLLVRDPFPVVNTTSLFPPALLDHNTRVAVFVRNLPLPQGAPANAVVVNLIGADNQSYDIPAEDVRPVANTDFVQVIFRLPDTLAVGVCKVQIKVQSQVSNAGTFRIRL